jgi:hypothetical protein
MKKKLILLALTISLTGCVETMALLGPASSIASGGGKIVQSSVSSAVSYSIKKKTGKSPIGHALSLANKKQKIKDPCTSFVEKTNSKICAIVKKQINSSKAKIENQKTSEKPIKEFSLSIQPAIDKKFSINYLDK